jgi:hypothetical protein
MFASAYGYGAGWMMGGYGWNNRGSGPGGMMGGYGGMMNGYGSNNANAMPLNVDQVKAATESYLANLKNNDLKIAEIMIFDNHAYVVVKEISTGLGAFELLVDPSSQSVYPEHGPNMMWNLKYGVLNHQNMMGNNGMMSMMGGNSSDTFTPADVSSEMTLKPEQAVQYAQDYLDANIAGATAAMDPIPLYGYYTIDFEKDGKVAGMLSVNGDSGQVFLHTWHGSFIEETEH